MIYVLTESTGDPCSGFSTTLLFADIDQSKIEPVKAVFESIAVKKKAANQKAFEHMQKVWVKDHPRPENTNPPSEPKKPKGMSRQKFETEFASELEEYRRECKKYVDGFRKIHQKYTDEWVAEQKRVFNENMSLTDEERKWYDLNGNGDRLDPDALFHIEEVPMLD